MLQGSIGGEGVVGLRLNHGSEVGGRGAMLPSYGFDPAEVVIHARSLPGSGLGKGFGNRRRGPRGDTVHGHIMIPPAGATAQFPKRVNTRGVSVGEAVFP